MQDDLGWREAAIEVLKNQPEAMHYTRIADEIIRRGLRTKVGANPSISVNVAISDSLRNFPLETPFDRTAMGYYRLRKTDQAGLENPAPGTVDVASEVSQAEPEPIEQDPTGLINALGMYWSRERIDWSRSTPKLLGVQSSGSEPVDFAEQRGVYLLYDRNEIVYVGRAAERGVGVRLREHTVDRLAGRWDRFSWFGVFSVSESGDLAEDPGRYDQSMLIATMEALLIESVEPRQNRRRGDDFKAVEFLQTDDPEVKLGQIKRSVYELLGKIGP